MASFGAAAKTSDTLKLLSMGAAGSLCAPLPEQKVARKQSSVSSAIQEGVGGQAVGGRPQDGNLHGPYNIMLLSADGFVLLRLGHFFLELLRVVACRGVIALKLQQLALSLLVENNFILQV